MMQGSLGAMPSVPEEKNFNTRHVQRKSHAPPIRRSFGINSGLQLMEHQVGANISCAVI